MNIYIMLAFGIAGLLTGYKIQDVSLKIMEYKRGKDISLKPFLFSQRMKIFICLLNTIMWVAATLYIDNIAVGLLVGAQITLALIITFIDINIRIIPNELILTMLVLGALFQVLNFGFKALITAVITMVVMMAVFMSVGGFVGLGKVGAGDVKLVGAMGLSLGYPLIIIAVFIMAIVLLVYIVTGLLMKKIYLSTMLPLAPFIMSGYGLALVGFSIL